MRLFRIATGNLAEVRPRHEVELQLWIPAFAGMKLKAPGFARAFNFIFLHTGGAP
jgi:hypothetical protein